MIKFPERINQLETEQTALSERLAAVELVVDEMRQELVALAGLDKKNRTAPLYHPKPAQRNPRP